MERITLVTKPQDGYELLDSGGEEKLERFGSVVLSRPDPQALWNKQLGSNDWGLANGKFERDPSTSSGQAAKGGRWVGKLEKEWPIEFGGLTFLIKPTSFKHTGLFPEQLSNWEWVGERIALATKKSPKQNGLASPVGKGGPDQQDEEIRGPFGEDFSGAKVLNLFGYTGGATLAAAKAGAEVTHVDASKTAVAWARENAKLSGLEDAPIRFMVDDVMQFVKKEIKRGKKYDGIIMDPPAFGHGPAGELWKIEENFIELVKLCQELLSDKPLFFLINGYAAGYSPLAFAYNLEPIQKKFSSTSLGTGGGEVEYGDIAIQQSNSNRLLPAGIFARWRSN